MPEQFSITQARPRLHFLVGDGSGKWATPLALALITLASWALRPPARRLAAPVGPADRRIVPWIVPILVLVVLFILSIVFLPKGPPPA